MNGCRALRDELAEAALGAAPSEALSNHLKTCAACVTELERQRAVARRMSAAVDRLVRAEPPFRLVERIAARARLAPPPQPWIGTWRPVAAVGAFVTVVIGLLFGLHELQAPVAHTVDVAVLTAWRSPTAMLLERRGSVLDAPLHLTAKPKPSRK